MKQYLIHILLSIGALTSSLAQSDGISYLNFDLQADNGFVTIRWEVIAGYTCQDVEIWRGNDSLNLKNIYTYAGICGDDDSNKVYQYIDKPATNGRFYFYQIKVFSEKSLVKKVLNLSDDVINFYPNPMTDFLNIVYSPNSKMDKIEFYNSQGKLTCAFENIKPSQKLDVSKWGSGVYLYRAYFKNQITSGQVVKQ